MATKTKYQIVERQTGVVVMVCDSLADAEWKVFHSVRMPHEYQIVKVAG